MAPVSVIGHEAYLGFGQSGEPSKTRAFSLAGGRKGRQGGSRIFKESRPQGDLALLKMERPGARTRERYLDAESRSLPTLGKDTGPQSFSHKKRCSAKQPKEPGSGSSLAEGHLDVSPGRPAHNLAEPVPTSHPQT